MPINVRKIYTEIIHILYFLSIRRYNFFILTRYKISFDTKGEYFLYC